MQKQGIMRVLSTVTIKLRRLQTVFISGLQQPHQLALAVTLAVLTGLLPLFFIPTFLLLLVASLFRLNIGLMMVFNYAVWPLQILLFVPYIQLGNWLFGGSAPAISFSYMAHLFKVDFMHALRQLTGVLIMATGAWAVTGVPFGLILYAVLRYVAGLTRPGREKWQPFKHVLRFFITNRQK